MTLKSYKKKTLKNVFLVTDYYTRRAIRYKRNTRQFNINLDVILQFLKLSYRELNLHKKSTS